MYNSHTMLKIVIVRLFNIFSRVIPRPPYLMLLEASLWLLPTLVGFSLNGFHLDNLSYSPHKFNITLSISQRIILNYNTIIMKWA